MQARWSRVETYGLKKGRSLQVSGKLETVPWRRVSAAHFPGTFDIFLGPGARGDQELQVNPDCACFLLGTIRVSSFAFALSALSLSGDRSPILFLHRPTAQVI